MIIYFFLCFFKLTGAKIFIKMDLEISATDSLNGTVKAPPSKSCTHRAIMLAGLSNGECKVKDPLMSADPISTIGAMRLAGAKISKVEDYLDITGNGGDITAPDFVDVGNSGTTMRILTSIFSLCSKKVVLDGDESIRKRPMGPLLDALEGVGVTTSSKDACPPISVKGPITGDIIKIRGDLSSQYISGLLMAAPLRDVDTTTIEITTELKSRPYLDLTLEALRVFGIELKNEDYKTFTIPGRQILSADEYLVEGDYSGAAFVLGAAALTDSKVTVRNLLDDSRQGDRYFLEILEMMGAKIERTADTATVFGGKRLRGIEVDLSQTPDLLPITAVMCALAEGKSRIFNVEHARIKECDRINAMTKGLQKMGVKIQERRDGMVIEGLGNLGRNLESAKIESFSDHRIVMAFAVAGLRAKGKTLIDNGESVAVSFPEFISVMRGIGADLSLNEA